MSPTSIADALAFLRLASLAVAEANKFITERRASGEMTHEEEQLLQDQYQSAVEGARSRLGRDPIPRIPAVDNEPQPPAA